MVYTLRFFSLKCSLFHNSNLFGSCIIHILYTECAKIKKNNSGAKRLRSPKRCKSLGARAKLEAGSPTTCQPQHRTQSYVSSDPSKSTSVMTGMWLRCLLLRNTKFCSIVDNTLICKWWLHEYHVHHVSCVSTSRNNSLGTNGLYLICLKLPSAWTARTTPRSLTFKHAVRKELSEVVLCLSIGPWPVSPYRPRWRHALRG